MEQWRDIPDYEGLYMVSDAGRVRSADRNWANGIRSFKGKILNPTANAAGYHVVNLSVGGRRKMYLVHALVAAAFLGKRPCNAVICHSDDAKLNNTPSNLYYGTQKDNAADARRNGRHVCGQDFPNAKLTKNAVLDIRARSGLVTKTALAHEYGVSRAAIRKIINHQLWRGV